jgi:hypothetical protein
MFAAGLVTLLHYYPAAVDVAFHHHHGENPEELGNQAWKNIALRGNCIAPKG